MQSVGESFDQGALRREGGLGRGFLGGEFEGGGGMLETQEEGAGVFEILVCYMISLPLVGPVEQSLGEGERRNGDRITAEVLMRS